MSKKKRKHKKKSRGRKYSTLEQHSLTGKTLVPPFLRVPNITLRSWRDQRLPEMLWAVLLVGNLPREQALAVFREEANFICGLTSPEILADVTHTGLSRLPEPILEGFINILIARPEQKRVLRSLLILEKLPARQTWDQIIGNAEAVIDSDLLMTAVAKALDHQSQESTDCRWMRVLAMGAAGRLHLPTEEMVKELDRYPDYGDMRKVRPLIRATEGALVRADRSTSDWAKTFWEECWGKFRCFPLNLPTALNVPRVGTTQAQIQKVHTDLLTHFLETNTTTAIDARHDFVFGSAFYSLAILMELLRIGVAQSIIARSGLRTLLECYITLRYLSKKNDPALWMSYRVFGSAQAKLTFLKLVEDPGRPTSISIDTVNALANEDVWQEFLPINLGHWENSNLRKLSIDSDSKDDYDRYYSWTSGYSHGHWGPIRESVLDVCGNPLHRLHRIPVLSAKALPDVISDACTLVDKLIELVNANYPSFSLRVSIEDANQNSTMANDAVNDLPHHG